MYQNAPGLWQHSITKEGLSALGSNAGIIIASPSIFDGFEGYFSDQD
jgi:hypothetical protein